MGQTKLGIMMRADDGQLFLSSPSGQELQLSLWGYRQRLHQLVQLCREDRIPLFLNGHIPLDGGTVDLLREMTAAGVHLWADRTFRAFLQERHPDAGLDIRPAHEPPPGAYPVSVFTMIRDPIWRILQDLAIPLPRRMAAVVEPPPAEIPASTMGEYFSHFLDSGGLITDLTAERHRWFKNNLLSSLREIFPQCQVTDMASAALLGALRTHDTLRRHPDTGWLLVHAGAEICTVFALKNRRLWAAFAHDTTRLTPGTLNEYLAQLMAGRRFERELLLDGGLFLQTRLLPEETGPWDPLLLTGEDAARFATLPGVQSDEMGRLAWTGLRTLLGLEPDPLR